MDIYILDRDLHPVGIIDSYTSLIWTTRYFLTGDFELYLPATKKAIDTLREKYYLCRKKDISQEGSKIRYKNVMIIEKIQVVTSIEDGNNLIVTGRSLKSILKRRIIWSQTNLNGKVESGIRRIITENAISPSDSSRKIQRLVLSPAIGLTDTIEIQITGDNLGETVESMCTTYGYGYDIDILGDDFVFYLYNGKNRSYSQTENPFVVFSNRFENLISTDYSVDIANYKNVALVAGEGEGSDRKTQKVGSASDLDRFEVYVDARDVSTNNGEYTEAEYAEMLKNRGLKFLSENPIVESFSGETETRLTYKLNEDYFLGDIVQVINEYGIEASPRILEIIESDGQDGESIIPTFSTLEV